MKVFNMEIIDIIKEAFIFPSNNLEKLAIYIVLTFVMGMLVVGGIFSFVFSSQSSALLIVGLNIMYCCNNFSIDNIRLST